MVKGRFRADFKKTSGKVQHVIFGSMFVANVLFMLMGLYAAKFFARISILSFPCLPVKVLAFPEFIINACISLLLKFFSFQSMVIVYFFFNAFRRWSTSSCEKYFYSEKLNYCLMN